MTGTLRLVHNRPVVGGVQSDPHIDAYMFWARELRGLRPTTLKHRLSVLKRLSAHASKPLVEVTEADLLRWERDYVVGKAPESRRAYISHVQAWFRWAVKTRLIPVDLSECLTRPRLQRGLPRPVSDDDFQLALIGARRKMRLWLLLAGFCGLRCQEIAGLTWQDLDTSGDISTLLIREGKGGEERYVPVPAPVLEAFIAFGRKRSGVMFLGHDGHPQTSHSISLIINNWLRRRGLTVTAHQFRHRYATTAYRTTKDIRLVQELLGHSSPATTARYAAPDLSQTADMVTAMEEQWTARNTLQTPGVG